MRTLVTALLLALLIPAPGFAQVPNECECEAFVTCPGMRLNVCPAGDYDMIADGCGTGTDYIGVYIRDHAGVGIPGIPVTDYWMNSCNAQCELCVTASSFIADSPTDSDGFTKFSGTLSAGGCSLMPACQGIWIACQGYLIRVKPACEPACLDIVIVGPDINADCQVNLSDLAFFGESYALEEGDPNYNTCCDYNDDGKCNLSDFSFFGLHYGH